MDRSTLGRKARRVAGAVLVLDGMGSCLLGRAYARLWQIGPADSAYGQAIGWVAARPSWQIRLAGLVEVAVGMRLLRSAPFAVPELYSGTAELYEKIETRWRDWLYVQAHSDLDRAMVTHLTPDGHILDLGCGTGANLARLLDLGQPFASYTGVDVSAAMLAQANIKAEGRDNVQFLQRDVEQDALPEGPFDLIVATWTLEHFADPAAAIGKAWERLRPGGHMVLLSLVDTAYWWNDLVRPAAHFFGDRFLPEQALRTLPGLVDYTVYHGAFGAAALVLLHKPQH